MYIYTGQKIINTNMIAVFNVVEKDGEFHIIACYSNNIHTIASYLIEDDARQALHTIINSLADGTTVLELSTF